MGLLSQKTDGVTRRLNVTSDIGFSDELNASLAVVAFKIFYNFSLTNNG